MSNSVPSRTGRASARRAWLVCLGCGLALFTVMGLGINGFTVYQPYLLERFHLTNGQGSWITTVRSLFSLLSMASKPVIAAAAEMISVFNADPINVAGQATVLIGGSAVWI